MRARIWSFLIFVLLAACGGGNDSKPPPLAAPSNLSYQTPQVFLVGQAIAAMSPTITGSVASYSVSPALPVGLSINATSGVISGTPTAPSAGATYTVTATNASGSTAAAISVTVNDAAPSISYDNTTYTFVTEVPTTVAPANSGGAAVSWSISEPLPDGLTFNTSDGSISGAPTKASPAATYAITAQNSIGSDTFELSIAVDSGVLFELGHGKEIVAIRNTGNRVLSIDQAGHWVLWNLTTAAILTRGDVACANDACAAGFVDIAGDTVAVRTTTGIQLRDATDGRVLSNFETTASWWKLATNGIYVAAGAATEVTAWDRDGTIFFAKAGDYSSARAFAADAEVRIATGPVGADRIETIAVLNGASSTSAPFEGQFHSWFLDGERFLTTLNDTVRVYGADAVQQDVRAMTTLLGLTGQGKWFWTAPPGPSDLAIYEVGASASPSASYPFPWISKLVASKDTIGIMATPPGSPEQLSIVDLSGATPVKTDYAATITGMRQYGSISSSQWLVSDQYGVLVTASAPAPRDPAYFGWGMAHSIAATPVRIAVATARGEILYFDATTRQLEGTIDFATRKVQLSADGTILLPLASRSLTFFTLPSATVLSQTPYPPTHAGYDVSLAASGTVFSENRATASTFERRVNRVSDLSMIWMDQHAFYGPARLSPDGSANTAVEAAADFPTTTNIIVNGTLASTVHGRGVGWLEDDRLLVNTYAGVARDEEYVSAVIVNRAGQQTGSVPNLPELAEIQPMTSERLYSPERNSVVSWIDGRTLWTSPNPTSGVGGVTATHVIFGSRGSVRAEPY